MTLGSVYLATVAGNPDTLIRRHPTDDELVESFGKVAGQHWHSLALVADIRPAAIIDHNHHALGDRDITAPAVAILEDVEQQWRDAQ